MPCKFGVLTHNISSSGTGEEIGNQTVSLNGHARFCLVSFPHIHIDASGSIDKYSVCPAFFHREADVERNGGIHSYCCCRVVAGRIDIPDGEGLSAFIHWACALTQTIDTLFASKWASQA